MLGRDYICRRIPQGGLGDETCEASTSCTTAWCLHQTNAFLHHHGVYGEGQPLGLYPWDRRSRHSTRHPSLHGPANSQRYGLP